MAVESTGVDRMQTICVQIQSNLAISNFHLYRFDIALRSRPQKAEKRGIYRTQMYQIIGNIEKTASSAHVHNCRLYECSRSSAASCQVG